MTALQELYNYLDIDRYGRIGDVPLELPSRFLVKGSFVGEKPAYDGYPIQITMSLLKRADRFYRDYHALRLIDSDIWQLFTGSHSYFYDRKGKWLGPMESPRVYKVVR